MSKQTTPLGSARAFRKWRGKRPTGGYGYDLMKWDYEDRDMRMAWDAAVAWAMTNNASRPAAVGSGGAEGGEVGHG